MDDYDIFRRTLKCRSIEQSEESEIEIFEAETEPLVEEEEVEEEATPEAISPEEEIDLEQLVRDFECIKKRMMKLLVLLKERGEPEETGTCCEAKEICALQKALHEIQCQIYEVVAAFEFIRKQIHDLHAHFCRQSKQMDAIKRQADFLENWRVNLQPDEGVCFQRYNYIKATKADWTDVEEYLNDQTRCPKKICERYVHKTTHNMNTLVLQGEIEKIKGLFVGLYDMKENDFVDCVGDPMAHIPLKQIETDYIDRQIKINRETEDKRCAPRLHCEKLDF